jgi:hypothetical protein
MIITQTLSLGGFEKNGWLSQLGLIFTRFRDNQQ